MRKGIVYNHKLSPGIQVMLWETVSKFSNSGNYFTFVKLEKSPLKFVVFGEREMNEQFGSVNEHIVNATMALVFTRSKNTDEKKALSEAIKSCVYNGSQKASLILAEEYKSKYGKLPKTLESADSTFAFQRDDQGDNLKIKKWDEKIEDMEDAIELDEAKSQPKDKNAVPSNSSDPAQELKDSGYKSVPGWGSYWSRSGGLPAEKKIEDGKILDVAPGEGPGAGKGIDGPDQQSAKPKRTVKAVPADKVKDGKLIPKKAEKKSVKDVESAGKASDYSSSLNSEQTSGKNKKIDQKAAKSATKSKYYTEDTQIDDKEFDYKNEGLWASDEYRLTLSEDITNGKMPKKEVKTLERLINTLKKGPAKKITHFAPTAGAGEIGSQAGELCMQLFASMPVEDREEIKNDIIDFLKETGNKSCLDVSWVEAAYNNSMAMSNYLDLRYGEGKYELVASAWDTKEGVQALAGRDMHSDGSKGYSTDAFFTVKGPDGNVDLIEISLKKDLNVKLLNSGPSDILSKVPELKGGNLDYDIFKSNEREFLQRVATKQNLEKSIKLLVDAEKNISKYSKQQQNKIKEAINAVKAIDKGMNPEKVIQALKERPGGSDEMRAAWKPLYVGSEVFGDKGFSKIKEEASKMYSDYQKNFLEEFKKNKNVEKATMDIVRKELPLVAVLENEEVLMAGEYSLDRVTMKEIFGVDDPAAFKETLNVYENPPPPFIGYAAKGKGNKPIPIALIRMRAESLGYGQRIKFDMDIHSEFANLVKKANKKVYGNG